MARRTAAVTVASLAVVCCLLLSVYLAFFRHPPASVILASQNGDHGHRRIKLEEGKQYTASQIAEAVWNKWIADNRHVSIGSLYDSCDPQDRIMIGKTILLPDKTGTGVMTSVHLNASFDEAIQYGEFCVNITYNGRHLYDNHFDLCTYDHDEPNPMIHCPLPKGPYIMVKDFQVPSYLPKGRYQTVGWVTNEEKKTVICGYADITI